MQVSPLERMRSWDVRLLPEIDYGHYHGSSTFYPARTRPDLQRTYPGLIEYRVLPEERRVSDSRLSTPYRDPFHEHNDDDTLCVNRIEEIVTEGYEFNTDDPLHLHLLLHNCHLLLVEAREGGELLDLELLARLLLRDMRRDGRLRSFVVSEWARMYRTDFPADLASVCRLLIPRLNFRKIDRQYVLRFGVEEERE